MFVFGYLLPLFIICMTVEPITRFYEMKVVTAGHEFLSDLSYDTLNKLEEISIYYESGGKVKLDRHNNVLFRRYYLETRGRKINE